MKEFRENFEEGLTKGLRRFKTNPRNNQALLDCHNWEPTEKGLKPREELEGLTIVNLPGDIDDTIVLGDIYWYGDGYPEFPSGEGPEIEAPDITFPCPDVSTFAWNESISAQTITTPGAGGINSVTVAIIPGVPPYTWSVSGTGFSLENETTEGTSNTLYADDTACGTALITVTDLCGEIVTGYVRASEGDWCLTDIHSCTISGSHTGAYTGTTLIKNQYKQTVAFVPTSGSGGCGSANFHCEGDSTAMPDDPCGNCGNLGVLGTDRCATYYNVNRSTTPCGFCVTNDEELFAVVADGKPYEFRRPNGCEKNWCLSYYGSGCNEPSNFNKILCAAIYELKVWEWLCACP